MPIARRPLPPPLHILLPPAGLFAAEAARIIDAHDVSEPLFMYVCFQNAHDPYEAPPAEMLSVGVARAPNLLC